MCFIPIPRRNMQVIKKFTLKFLETVCIDNNTIGI